MDQEGLAQVIERLGRLRSAAKIVGSPVSLAEQESAWLDFLQYHGTIYAKLEQTSKATPSARKWYDAKKAERKTDGLLRYLQHARNVGEHTILKASGKAVFAVSGIAQGTSGSIGISFDRNGRPSASGAGLGDMKVHRNAIMLLAATDRGVVYELPREHLGEPLHALTACEVAILALEHAEIMIKEAESFDPPASVSPR